MTSSIFKVLIIGDIVGKPGRKIVIENLQNIKADKNIDFVIANGENCAGGFGITGKIANNLLSNGIDVITSGNHIWKNKDIISFIKKEPRLLKPLNYPDSTPGRGYHIYSKNDINILVVNLLGRKNLLEVDCPFNKIDDLLKNIDIKKYDISIVDFHAETTSEKVAMGWFLNGRVTGVIGTHTHIQTADERILDKDTAYISDVGMSGGFDSVLGVDKDRIIHHFLSMMPMKFKMATKNLGINSVIIEIDMLNKKPVKIERFNYFEE